MDNNWQFTAVEITKYDPAFRDQNHHYTKNEWIGFFQIGKTFEDGVLTFETYLQTEKKYIQAALLFFEFHDCKNITVRTVEKNEFSDYKYEDREQLFLFYNKITEGCSLPVEEAGSLIKLILRELLWAELFCSDSNDIAIRFGYDFYMTFNSNRRDMDDLYNKIKALGLYIGR